MDLSGGSPIPGVSVGTNDGSMPYDDDTDTTATGSVATTAPPPPPPPGAPAGAGPGDEPPARHKVLQRARRGRVVAGVAAGVASYFDIDVVIVRIAFVVLTVIGGSGALLYLVGWLLIPNEPEDGDGASAGADTGAGPEGDETRRRGNRILRIVVAVVATIAAIDLFTSGPWWPHWGWNLAPGFWLFFLALVLLVVLVSRRPDDSAAARIRRLLLVLLVTVVALATVTFAAVLTAEAMTGVPLRGGMGDSQWRPASSTQVARDYRLAVGRLTVDLSGVSFPAGTTHVTASVGIGQVVVEVPTGTDVSVTAHSGMGDVWVFGTDDGGFGATRSFDSPGTGNQADATAHLVLEAQAGLGQVRIVRD